MANVFIKSNKAKNKKFKIIEESSKLELKVFSDYNEARAFARVQNKGGGFAGHTPPFMLKSVKDVKA